MVLLYIYLTSQLSAIESNSRIISIVFHGPIRTFPSIIIVVIPRERLSHSVIIRFSSDACTNCFVFSNLNRINMEKKKIFWTTEFSRKTIESYEPGAKVQSEKFTLCAPNTDIINQFYLEVYPKGK